MPNTKSALKRVRSSERRRIRNRRYSAAARTHIKKARAAMAAGDVETARQAVQQAVVTLDKAVSKGVLPKRNAARRKSRIMRQLAALEKAQAQIKT